MFNEKPEQFHLLLRQMDGSVSGFCRHRGKVEGIASENVSLNRRRFRCAGSGSFVVPSRTGQQAFDPQQKFRQVKRLGEIIIDAAGKGLDPVIGRPLG